MRTVIGYIIRALLVGLISGIILRLGYGTPTQHDSELGLDYAVVCGILAMCGVVGWLLRSRRSKAAQFITSAVIAAAACLFLIVLSEWTHYVDGMPWQYFYKDDYIAVFQFVAPVIIGLLSGALLIIPDRFHIRRNRDL
ncbi:hypothetical protein [Edaphobacter flagellatus]|uniref:hypothetical protein n=1 Tax=Edaphobacter flagellatus TaxID=1933044 RepID=UPI0021B217DB|nr:hypothetical protein [Edaphobacter flagellatus]